MCELALLHQLPDAHRARRSAAAPPARHTARTLPGAANATPGLTVATIVTGNPERAERAHTDYPQANVVADADALFAQAVTAGASEVFPVGEEYGWRLGRVVDPFGHHWEIGHPLAA